MPCKYVYMDACVCVCYCCCRKISKETNQISSFSLFVCCWCWCCCCSFSFISVVYNDFMNISVNFQPISAGSCFSVVLCVCAIEQKGKSTFATVVSICLWCVCEYVHACVVCICMHRVYGCQHVSISFFLSFCE